MDSLTITDGDYYPQIPSRVQFSPIHPFILKSSKNSVVNNCLKRFTFPGESPKSEMPPAFWSRVTEKSQDHRNVWSIREINHFVQKTRRFKRLALEAVAACVSPLKQICVKSPPSDREFPIQ
jgi:hypothetical protein